MNCPNCNHIIEYGNICPSCGLDAVLFKKTYNTSAKLYNKALLEIERNNLSHALELLSKSIEFNKGNVSARNVMGLIYYETGCLGEALKQWIISHSIQKEDNLADHYMNALQENSRELEKLNDSIRMYNQSLTYVRQRSVDMAIIQLKKALNLNPGLLEARNLLALCYVHEKDYRAAETELESVLQKDIQNPKAVEYYRQLRPERRTPPPAAKVVSQQRPAPQKTVQAPAYQAPKKVQKEHGFSIWGIMGPLLGAAACAAIMFVLVVPGMVESKSQESKEWEEKYNDISNQYRLYQGESEETIRLLEEEKTSLENSNQTLQNQLLLLDTTQKLDEIQSMVARNELADAAELLYGMSIDAIPQELRQDYDEIREDLFPRASTYHYNQGVTRYNQARYEEAQDHFVKSFTYSATESSSDDCLYFLGRIAEVNEDYATARSYYERLMRDYPDSNMYNNASTRLNNLD